MVRPWLCRLIHTCCLLQFLPGLNLVVIADVPALGLVVIVECARPVTILFGCVEGDGVVGMVDMSI